MERALELAGERHPDVGLELLRLTAVPRRLDADVAAILGRGLSSAPPERILAALADLSFVAKGTDGGLVIHDAPRRRLLHSLRETAERRRRLADASERLFDLYRLRYDETMQAVADIDAVADTLGRANPDRLGQVRAAVEGSLTDTLNEAVYHLTLLDPRRGHKLFVELFDTHLDKGHTASCRAVLGATRAALRDHGPGGDPGWLRPSVDIRDARLKNRLGRHEEARSLLEGILEAPLEDHVRDDALAELGAASLELEDLPAARAALQEAVELGIKTGEEPLRTAERLRDLGNACVFMTEWQAAEVAYGDSVAYARGRDAISEWHSQLMHAYVRLVLNGVHASIAEFLECIDIARTTLREHRALAAHTTQMTGEAINQIDPGLLCTVLAEFEEIAAVPDEAEPAVEHALKRVHLLQQGELLDLAQEALDPLRAEHPDDVQVLLATGALASSTGSLEAAERAYAAVANHEEAKLSDRGTAQMGRAEALLALGRLEDAALASAEVVQTFLDLGSPLMRRAGAVLLAEAQLAAGDAVAATATLEEPLRELSGFPLAARGALTIKGRLEMHGGRHEDAHRTLLDALRIYGYFGPTRDEVLAASAAAEAALWSGRRDDAAALLAHAAQQAAALEERAHYRPSADEAEVNRANARLVRALAEPTPGTRAATKIPADGETRSRHQGTDATSVPVENWWHRMNHGYFWLSRDDLIAASREFRSAVEAAPELLRSSALAVRATTALLAAAHRALESRHAEALELACRAEETSRALAVEMYVPNAALLRGDAHLRLGNQPDAEKAFTDAYEAAVALKNVYLAAIAAARAAVATLEPDQVRVWLERSLELLREKGSSRPYWEMVAICSLAGEPWNASKELRGALLELRTTDGSNEMREYTPGLTAQIPQDWDIKESVTFFSPDRAANVIVTSEPLDEPMDTDEYARRQGRMLTDEFPGYEPLGEDERRKLGERDVVVRRFRWQPEDSLPVIQIQLYHAAAGRGVTATATTTAERFPELELELEAVIAALGVE